jgi:signal transduction histidine kinase
MFDRFWRADDSRARSSGGAGLGLAIAHGLVHAHGGRIWAETAPGAPASPSPCRSQAGAPADPLSIIGPRSVIYKEQE